MTEIQHIFLTPKIILQAIILTAISLLFIPFCSSLEYNFNIPSSMDLESEVKVSVSAPSSTYDIKIFFAEDGSEISGEINVNGEWKNSRYYIQDIEFSEKQFEIRLKNSSISPESLAVCVRLREFSSTSTPTKQCISINVNSNSDKINSESTPENSKINQESQNANSLSQPSLAPVTNQPDYSSNLIELDTSPILLKSSSEQSFNTSIGKSRLIINLLVAFAVLLTIYMILRSESKYREI